MVSKDQSNDREHDPHLRDRQWGFVLLISLCLIAFIGTIKILDAKGEREAAALVP